MRAQVPAASRTAGAPAVLAVPDRALATVEATAEWLRQSRTDLRGRLRDAGAVLLPGLPVRSVTDVATVRDALIDEPAAPLEPFAPRTPLGHGLCSDLHWPPERVLCPQYEQCYRLRFPTLVLLACLRPAASGGETLLADGRAVRAQLPTGLVDRLERHGWLLTRTFRERFGVPWWEAFGTTDKEALEHTLAREMIGWRWMEDGSLRTARLRPAVIHHPDDGRACWFNHAGFFNEWGLGLDPEERQVLHETFGPDGLTLNTMIGDGTPLRPDEVATIDQVYEEVAVPVPLVTGDVLVIDNIATAHGRRPFSGEREIAVAMGEPVDLSRCRPTVAPAPAAPAGAHRPEGGRP